MMWRFLILAAAALASQGSAVAQNPPAIPPEIASHVPKNLRPYFVAFFVTPAKPKPMSRELFIRHQNYMRGQFEKGVYRLAGPHTDNGRIRGLMILSASSAEEARRIVEADPAVQEGVMAVEAHPAMFPDLSSLKVEYPARK